MKPVILAFLIVALVPVAALADEKALQEFAEREAKQLNQQRVLNEHSPDEYAKALATAARTGVSPAWAKEYGAALERQRKAGIFGDGYEQAIIDAGKAPSARVPERSLHPLILAIGISVSLLSLFVLYRWMPWRALFGRSAPVEMNSAGSQGTGDITMSRFEIALLWIAGLWAVLVFVDSDLVRGMGFHRSYRGADVLQPLFAGWIPLALIAITRRFWR